MSNAIALVPEGPLDVRNLGEHAKRKEVIPCR